MSAYQDRMSALTGVPVTPAPIRAVLRRCKHGHVGCMTGWCEPVSCTELNLWHFQPPLEVCWECYEKMKEKGMLDTEEKANGQEKGGDG